MDAFESAYNHLNAQQREAVDHIEGPLLVIAGPGTGKTQLLSVRVANILKQTDVGPENILCLTFTETGASNMRHRLADFIGPEAYKVQIQTYHSFGTYILQEHRPDLNSAIDELERFTIIREIQSHLDPTDILRPDHVTKDVISAISNLKAAAIGPEDIRKIVKRNQVDDGLIYSAISEDLQQTTARYPKCVPYYENILAALKTFVDTAPEYIVSKVEPLAKIYYRSLAEILIRFNEGEKVGTELRAWREKYFKKDKDNIFVFGDLVATKKLASLGNIMEQYFAYLDREGKFDYDDMILSAIKLLKEDDEKRYNTQERFQYILLDEFQDTNDAQAQLVSLITDNPANERPNIMAVGDDDQAIYGFQGANTSNFFDFDAHYKPHHVFLTKNYRSSAEILEFSHNVIEQSIDRFCKAPNVNIDKHITSENPPAETNIDLREFQSSQEEYSYVVNKIKDLLDQGVRGDKIAIIAPKHKYLVSILPYLHALKIPVSYVKRENILESTEVLAVINFCKLLLNLTKSPRDADMCWFELLSQPCWQLSPADVINIVQSARSNRRSIIEEMLASENTQYQDIANFCFNLAAKTNTYSAEYIISEVTNKLFVDSDNYEIYSNLNTLRDLARAKTKGDKLFLADFFALIDAHQKAEIDILNHSPYHESDSAIQLQTVHSSKGLEYDHVFLIAADNKNWSDAKGNTDKLALPRNLEFVRHTGDSNDEKIRVFFVAITRAKAMLHLSYALSNFAGQKSERLKYLDIREEKDASGNDVAISRVLPEKFSHLIESHATSISPDDIAPNTWFDTYRPDDETRKNLLRPLVEHYRISPTHLNTFIDIAYGGPENFLKSYILHIPGEYSASLAYGTCVHEVMDELNKEKLSNDEAMQRFMNKINELDATDEEREDLRLRGEGELRAFLDARGDDLRSANAKSELSFPGESIVLGDAILTGKLDRIEINEEDKTIVVSDFKTGKARDKWGTNDSSFKYKIQLYFYKFLIENSREYKNYRVVSGRIDYIAADDFGNIRPLVLEFKPDEEEKIKTLIQNVWRHIKELNFPPVVDYKTTKQFFDALVAE